MVPDFPFGIMLHVIVYTKVFELLSVAEHVVNGYDHGVRHGDDGAVLPSSYR